MPRLNRAPVAVFAVAVAAVVVAVIVGFLVWSDSSEDDAAMRNTAAQVMPFDLSRTEHSFTKTAAGGVQVVEVKDPADTENIELIHTHLQDEAVAFRKGNFSDPAKIHGMDMPGLRELEAGASRVQVVYEPTARGGRIVYSSDEPVLVTAIHQWFDRQTMDHSQPGMGG